MHVELYSPDHHVYTCDTKSAAVIMTWFKSWSRVILDDTNTRGQSFEWKLRVMPSDPSEVRYFSNGFGNWELVNSANVIALGAAFTEVGKAMEQYENRIGSDPLIEEPSPEIAHDEFTEGGESIE